MRIGGRQGPKRLGKGPAGQRDMDVDDDEETDELSMIDVRARVLASGFTEAQLMETIIEVSIALWLFAFLSIFSSTRIWMFGLARRTAQSYGSWRFNNVVLALSYLLYRFRMVYHITFNNVVLLSPKFLV